MDIEIKRIVSGWKIKGTEFSMKDANGELLLKRGSGNHKWFIQHLPLRYPPPAPACVQGTCHMHTLKFNRDYSPIVGTFYGNRRLINRRIE